jgi:hypothetical protein
LDDDIQLCEGLRNGWRRDLGAESWMDDMGMAACLAWLVEGLHFSQEFMNHA